MKVYFLALIIATISILSTSYLLSQKELSTAGFAGSFNCDGVLQGTGTLIVDSSFLYLVTAKHVIKKTECDTVLFKSFPTGRREDGYGYIKIHLPNARRAGQIYYSKSSDVALIVLGEKKAKGDEIRLAAFVRGSDPVGRMNSIEELVHQKDLVFGTPIMTIGFPIELSNFTKSKRLTFQLPLTRQGLIAGFTDDGKIVADMTVYGGNSGGPVYTMKNGFRRVENNSYVTGYVMKLIGIVIEYVPAKEGAFSGRGTGIVVSNNSGYSIVEPVDSILELIQKHQVNSKK